MINHCVKVSSVLSHIHVRLVYLFRSIYHNKFYFLKIVTKIKGKIANSSSLITIQGLINTRPI